MTEHMGRGFEGLDRLLAWFHANDEALLVGAIAAVALVAIMLVLRAAGERITAADAEYRSWKSVIGRVLAKTSMAFMVVAALEVVTTYVEPPHALHRFFDVLFIIGFSLQGAVWARELAIGVISHRVGEDSADTTLSSAMAIIRVLISVAVFAIAIIVILDNLGVNVTALVAGLGIGGIAIGLAAQGIFSDLFAALAILFDKPFRKGDIIRYDQSTGTVERIGLKTTRLRATTGEQVVMANTKLLDREIHNIAQSKARRVTLYLAVKTDRPADALDRIPQIADEAVTGVKGCRLVRCALTGLASGAVTHELVYDDGARDQDRLALDRSEIIRSVMEQLEAAGFELVRASDLPAPPAPF
jgi:small-conductance mechanosensitive channel